MFHKTLFGKLTGAKKQPNAYAYLIPKDTPQEVSPPPALTEEQIQEKCMIAAKNGDIEFIKKHVNKDNKNMCEKKTDKTLLHYAAENDQTAVITYLVELQAYLDAKDNKNDFTPLHSAAWKGAIKAVEVLIKAGASVEEVNRYGNTPLNIAKLHKQYYVATVLNNHIKGKTVLLSASTESMKQEIIELKATVKALQEKVQTLEKANNERECSSSSRFGFAGK